MKRFLLSFVFLWMLFFAKAQGNGKGTIAGSIADSLSRNAVEYATITVFAGNETKAINGTTTDKQGNFLLTGLDAGSYRIVIESIGYSAVTFNAIEVAKKASRLTLPVIYLLKNQTLLQDVVVNSSRGPVENKIDKLVFNAEKDLTAAGGVATDLLKKVPQVSVDVDGNVQLADNSSIRFLINGRPSSAFGSNIADVLQSIPASQIKSIEVVTNPGAKYDAQGLGGIINIILKQSKVKGINGSLALSGGSRTENGSLNLNARKGNLGIGAYISGNTRLPVSAPFSSDRTTTDPVLQNTSLLHQQGASRIYRYGYQTGVNADWTYKKSNNFSGSFNYNEFGNRSTVSFYQSLVTKGNAGSPVSETDMHNTSKSRFVFHNTDVSFGYKHSFKKEDREIEFSFNSSRGNNFSTVDNEQFLLPPDSLVSGFTSGNPAKENETEFKIDYTDPLTKNIVLGTGVKLNIFDITSASEVNSFSSVAQNFIYDAALSNQLRYKQKVLAVYTELGFPVGKIMEAKAGVRYERTNIDSYYSNAQQQISSPGYNTFVPSVFVLRKLTEANTLKLSYSKRIERPDYGDLNPFINTSDPKNISAGNPFLLPEIGHRIEFSYTHTFKDNGSVMITAFHRINQQDIQPYIVYYPELMVGDSVYKNVTVNTRQNIGSEKNSGLNIFSDVRITPGITLRSNLSMFYRQTRNALDAGYDSKNFNFRFNINAGVQISKTVAGELFGNFNSPRKELQGNYPSFTTYSLAVRKQVWNKKGSIAFTATNPFGKYVNQRTSLSGPNFTMNGFRQIPFRSFGLNFTWKFGKLEFKKDKEDNQPATAPVE